MALPPDEVLAAISASPVAYGAVFVLGTLFGSFANVCIYRWPPTDEHPHGRSVVHPGSHCGACGKPVRWYDNVPILAWLWLRGRCRDCGATFSARYLFVEAATGILFVATWHLCLQVGWFWEPLSLRFLRFAIFAALMFALVVITFIDLDHMLILDKVTLPAVPAFYALGLWLPERTWWDGLLGAAVGYGLVRLISDGYYALTKREGLGYGDGKLLALIGALFGWQGVATSLFVGSLLGSVIGVGVLLSVRRRRQLEAAAAGPAVDAAKTDDDDDDTAEPALRHTELPFGPFLAAGAIVYVFVQPWVRDDLARLFAP